MLAKIKAFFEAKPDHNTADTLAVDEAAAVLLIEVMMADHEIDEREQECITKILTARTEASPEDVSACIDQAMQRQHDTVDLYQFSRVINDHYSEDQRYQLVVDLWRVAFADGRLDMYEDQRIRRVNDLLHLHHSHFIRAKSEAQTLIPD